MYGLYPKAITIDTYVYVGICLQRVPFHAGYVKSTDATRINIPTVVVPRYESCIHGTPVPKSLCAIVTCGYTFNG